MFRPPRCPNEECEHHAEPAPGFYLRHGYYKPRCRSHKVPRFLCKGCGRSFSRQTFRADYRDHRPHLNLQVLVSIGSGVGLRQTARNLGISLRCCELKYRKLVGRLGLEDRDPDRDPDRGQRPRGTRLRAWRPVVRPEELRLRLARCGSDGAPGGGGTSRVAG